jgi:hypothetical protein
MSIRPGKSSPQPATCLPERRAENREAVTGNLWMIDSRGSTILRCLCVDASPSGMRLRVPLGYGVRAGQRYELTSHLPGQSPPPGLGLMVSRRAEVVRTEIVSSDDEYDVEVGVQLAPTRTARLSDGDPITAWA